MGKSHASAWASDAPTPAQLKEFFAQIEAEKITRDRLQRFLRGDGSAASVDISAAIREQIGLWERFYREILEMAVDFSSLRIPTPTDPGFSWLVVVPQGITSNRIVKAMRERQKIRVWTYTEDLDADVNEHERDPKDGSYAILVRNRIEADQEFADKSANDIREMGVATMTLPERLALESFYRSRTGEHLDRENVTGCYGSRDRDGSVPRVRWNAADGEVDVLWWYPTSRRSRIRPRQVVSV